MRSIRSPVAPLPKSFQPACIDFEQVLEETLVAQLRGLKASVHT